MSGSDLGFLRRNAQVHLCFGLGTEFFGSQTILISGFWNTYLFRLLILGRNSRELILLKGLTEDSGLSPRIFICLFG
jgi:hypothetical protein